MSWIYGNSQSSPRVGKEKGSRLKCIPSERYRKPIKVRKLWQMIVFGAWYVLTTMRDRKSARGRSSEIWQIQRQKEWKSP